MRIETALWLFVTLATAAVCGTIAKRAKVPTGAMIGAMAGVALLNIFTGVCVVPTWFRNAMQAASGAMIGSRIRRSDVVALRRVALPALVMIPCLLGINLLVGFAIAWTGGLDAATALFSSAPGGVAELSLIAADVGADTGIVSLLQLVRLFSVITIFPPIFKHLPHTRVSPDPAKDQAKEKIHPARYFLTAAAAAAGAFAGWALNIPAGPMIGSMVATTIVSVATGKTAFPSGLRTPVQFAAGAYIGSRMTMATVLSVGSLAVPALFLVASLFVNTFGIGELMHRISRVDRRTCLLASTPGGLQEMCLLADDLGADVTSVSVLQTARLFSVILLFPIMLELAIPLIGK